MKRTKCGRGSLGLQVTLAAIAAGVLALGATASPPDPPRYVLTPLGTLGGEFSQALGMNETGAVVGWSTTMAEPTDRPHAFVWEDGVMQDLGTLDGLWTEARSINEHRQIVGVSMVNTGHGQHGFFERHGVLWQDGVLFDLNDIVIGRASNPGSSIVDEPMPCYAPLRLLIEANQINDDGMIAGCGLMVGDDNVHGIVLVPREPYFATAPAYDWVDLGLMKGAPDCVAACINDAGHVVGTSGRRAFLHDGEMKLLEHYAPESAALAIDGYDTVVGWAGENDMVPTACMWQDGHHFDLATPGDWISEALDIADTGLIVGWIAENLGHPAQAMMWEGCIPVLLEEVTAIPLTEREPWSLEAATAIDAAGRIAGVGRLANGAPRAFLLVPVEYGEATAVAIR